MPTSSQSAALVSHVGVTSYNVPTDAPESDGTRVWDHTKVCVVHVQAGGQEGVGYTFGGTEVAALIEAMLTEVVKGADAMAPTETYMAMWRKIRSVGRPGVASMAISAVDCALWDLKARILEVPLATLLGPLRESAAVYGSGGFTSYSNEQLASQLGGWARQAISAVKMKIGRNPHQDP